MKNILTILAAILITGSVFAGPDGSDENVYNGRQVSYSVEKVGGEVVIHLNLENASDYKHIEIKRSTDEIDDFRRVKYIESGALTNNKTIVDKYPLSGQDDSYYMITTLGKDGVSRSYPSVMVVK